ncbi:metalloregulator ArsR/SmtB family transcription factor [Vitreoscilla massiliensis]|uniref:metalloregulator ArsR/SmtB family transcription factor n=1 Tax=Vitreoscilla massiliensis TaxID=1689272 RepID=UPI00071C6BCC|nr:metalloregulator ArsR/SmtB family transcription factor [Vitreoscilla massiliensis]
MLTLDMVGLFKLLSDPTRLDIVCVLAKHGERCVCDLTAHLQLSQPKISRHLALLRTQGLLSDQRQGQWVYYRLADNLPIWAQHIIQTIAAERDDLTNLPAGSCS